MTQTYSALDAVSLAIYTALNVSAVTNLATGGVGDDIAQNTGYPFVLYEVHETPKHHMGSQPGRSGQVVEIDLVVHVYTGGDVQGMSRAQQIMDQVVTALATPPAMTGWSDWAIFYDGAVNLGDQLVAGLKVKELAGRFRLSVELQ